MRVLIIGGSGLISTGIVKHLLARKADVTVFNRGQREDNLPPQVRRIQGQRSDVPAMSRVASEGKFDAIIDMIGFSPEQGRADIEAFAGKCAQFIFCSTVCTYGVKFPQKVLIDESFPQEPISEYGRNKVTCEKMFLEAHAAGKLPTTIIRPSNTYGPGASLIDHMHHDSPTWDRIEKGLPVICGGDGHGLWQSTHRDDVGKLFAYAVGNPRTLGKAFNATRSHVFTWRDYYREAGQALGKPVDVLFMPTDWIVAHDPKRYNLVHEITQYHGIYDSSAARREVPEFVCDIDFVEGARQTFQDTKRRNAWVKADDPVYQKMVDGALAAGVKPVRV